VVRRIKRRPNAVRFAVAAPGAIRSSTLVLGYAGGEPPVLKMSEFHATARRALLDRRTPDGRWEGHLSSSALSTATAVVALASARDAGVAPDEADRLIEAAIDWIVATRNADGGWGDTPDSVSNISTTALVWSALAYGNGPAVSTTAGAAEAWIARHAGSSAPEVLAAALAARYGKDRTFSVPILTMCAIAGRLGPSGWALIPPLPFELAVLPRGFYAALRLPVVSYALPALISMGLARHRRGPAVPVLSALRSTAAPRALRVLEHLQPEGGGFLEATPLTAFVTMSLVASGEPHHPVVARALDFLVRSMRDEGSWPIDTNLATWTTTLSVNALSRCDGLLDATDRQRVRDWLLGQQWTSEHPYTGAAPGGWAWTDLSGGVPDADDTAGALVALRHLDPHDPRVRTAATAGVRWLLDLQNRDGGIPTFCRGWGALPFDRSATDLTAHALRAWGAWRDDVDASLRRRIDRATARAIAFLRSSQRRDGAFVPLWFGNQGAPGEENPLYGTSRVVTGLAAASGANPGIVADMLARARRWLLDARNADGSWGGDRGVGGSIEETALAIDALTTAGGEELAVGDAVAHGLAWLAQATDGGRRFPPSPIGLYFARLWYSEELYPVIFTAAASQSAGRRHAAEG
jgi:squalene-hopene/tetraprenyl-beta-curcumene cyclase